LLAESWQGYWNPELPTRAPRWVRGGWTVVIAAAFAPLLTIISFVAFARSAAEWLDARQWAGGLLGNFIGALTIGLLIHGLFEIVRVLIGRERLQRMKPWQRTAINTLMPVIGVCAGWPIGYTLAGGDASHLWGSGKAIVDFLVLALAVAVLMTLYWSARHRQLLAEARATEAQLKLLQAQIEPHFLFNTLANVASLIDHDAPRAKQMLETFVDYLRGSLTQLRHEQSTLGDELAMAEAYLGLMQMRMEDRLQYGIEVDPLLRGASMPPLLLQPLVENAVNHGLEPKRDGGEVRIVAQRIGDRLVVEVRDNGLGLEAPPRPLAHCRGAGIALENLRQRLATHGGTLSLQAARPGTCATLDLPHRDLPAAAP